MSGVEITDCDNVSILTVSSADENAFYRRDGDDDMDVMETRESELVEATPNAPSIVPYMNGGGPTVERIGIETSTDVTIGNQTYFQGPVIIKNLTTGSDPTGKEKSAGEAKKQNWTRRKKAIFIISGVLVAILVTTSIVLIVLLQSPDVPLPDDTTTQPTTSQWTTSSSTTSTTTTTEATTTTTFRPITIQSRQSWTKHAEWKPLIAEMPHPIVEIYLGDTGRFSHWLCSDYAKCESDAKNLENRHGAEYPFGDLPFNFLVPNMEMILEGRGWKFDGSFSHTDSRGKQLLYVVMMGNFDEFPPTELQMDMFWSLINDGIQSGYVAVDYRIYGDCQAWPVKSPGGEFLNVVKEMERWSNHSVLRPIHDCDR